MVEMALIRMPSVASQVATPGSHRISRSLWGGTASGAAKGTAPSEGHGNEIIRGLRWCSQEAC